MNGAGSSLFSEPDMLLRLEQMSLASKSRIRGTMQGKRRSKQLGTSLEFADYRLYTPGDDIRRFDWNVYGRTGKPFIKQFMDEQELQVNLYVDTSKSMDFGQTGASGIGSKFLYARQLAACIGYITLCGYDRVSARLFSQELGPQLPMLRGKGSASRLFQFLEEAQIGSAGDIANALMKPAALPRQPGMTWLFSDFLFEARVEEALGLLLSAKQEVVMVQVLSPEELDPTFVGDLRLIDSESGMGTEVAMTGKVIQAYQNAVKHYTQGLQRYCHERNILYMLAVTNLPVSETILRMFRGSGLLR
jgi:uncharacterized protein (DUF58 family)